MGKTITVTGHETITGDNGDTFILVGKAASLSINDNSNSKFIMSGTGQKLTFAYILNGIEGADTNEHVTIKGTNDAIYNPPGDTPGPGLQFTDLSITGFNHHGSSYSSVYSWDTLQSEGHNSALSPDGHGGTDFYNGLGATVDFVGDTHIGETSATDLGHYVTLANT